MKKKKRNRKEKSWFKKIRHTLRPRSAVFKSKKDYDRKKESNIDEKNI